jgi:IstB-like ATP binding protein
MAAAALDRLLHRATVINIRGESYHLKEKRQAGVSLSSPKAIATTLGQQA